jgi:hypothetical protein
LAALFTLLGSTGMPKRFGRRLFNAKRLRLPPLCSKKAQKKILKKMKNRAAPSFKFSARLKVRISHARYTRVSGPTMYMNMSV